MTTYGHFDDAAREYVVTRPDTPLPWLNYLGQDDLFGLCTNTGGGYTFWRDARLRRLTRYRYNDAPYGLGRPLSLRPRRRDGLEPRLEADARRRSTATSAGTGSATRGSPARRNGVEVELLLFVPPGETAEVWKTTVRNTGATPKELTLFSFVEFCFYEALNDMTNFQRTYSIGEVEVEGSAIYHKTEYRERRDHYTLFGCTREIAGFDTSRDAFVGVHNGLHEAAVPFAGEATSSVAHGWNPIGSHQVNLRLEPGAEESFAFVLGYVEQGDRRSSSAPGIANKESGRALLERYARGGAVDAAFAAVRDLWADCSRASRRSARIRTRRGWSTRGTSTSAWRRSTCHGRRASTRPASVAAWASATRNQDVLGFVHLRPRARAAADPRHRRDAALRRHLLPPVPAADQEGQRRHRRRLQRRPPLARPRDLRVHHARPATRRSSTSPCGYADTPGSGESLLHHLETSIAYTLANRGPHGLPLIGHADWNDCLNLNCFSTEPDESFQTAGDVEGSQAESVHDRRALPVRVQRARRPLPPAGPDRRRGARREPRATRCSPPSRSTPGTATGTCARSTRSGAPVGSHVCDEGRIFIESQGWCVLGGAGRENGRARQALESVREHLGTDHGIVLHQPAVHAVPPRAGRDHELSAGRKGERRRLLPQQHLDHARLVRCSARASGRSSTTSRSARRRRRTSTSTAPSRTSTRR